MQTPAEKYPFSALFVVAALLLFGLSGCGSNLSAAPAAPAGIVVDSTTEQFFKSAFDETKACTGLTQGTYEDLSVVMMPLTFACPYYPSGCSGEFSEPNIVKVGTLLTWRHELVHYLLFRNTGDPDQYHHSPLFTTCGITQPSS